MATAEFSKFAGRLSTALSQHHLSGFEIAQLEFHHLHSKRAILHRNLECQVHESRQIGSGQTRDGQTEHQILGISELKWTGMGEFNSHDHYIYYCRQESLRRNGVANMVNKRD